MCLCRLAASTARWSSFDEIIDYPRFPQQHHLVPHFSPLLLPRPVVVAPVVEPRWTDLPLVLVFVRHLPAALGSISACPPNDGIDDRTM